MATSGAQRLTGDAGVTVQIADENNYALLCTGTVATSVLDAAGTYQKGCMYIDTDIATGTAGNYINVGTLAAPVWELVTSS